MFLLLFSATSGEIQDAAALVCFPAAVWRVHALKQERKRLDRSHWLGGMSACENRMELYGNVW
jgi:hypothetical protein